MNRRTVVIMPENSHSLSEEQKAILEENRLFQYTKLVASPALTPKSVDYCVANILKNYENIVLVEGAFLPLAIELAERCGEELTNKRQQPLVVFALVKTEEGWKLF